MQPLEQPQFSLLLSQLLSLLSTLVVEHYIKQICLSSQHNLEVAPHSSPLLLELVLVHKLLVPLLELDNGKIHYHIHSIRVNH
jgi:hypothetical protein